MRSFFLLLMLLPLFLFSQESELVSNTSEGFKGISIGLPLFGRQTLVWLCKVFWRTYLLSRSPWEVLL